MNKYEKSLSKGNDLDAVYCNSKAYREKQNFGQQIIEDPVSLWKTKRLLYWGDSDFSIQREDLLGYLERATRLWHGWFFVSLPSYWQGREKPSAVRAKMLRGIQEAVCKGLESGAIEVQR